MTAWNLRYCPGKIIEKQKENVPVNSTARKGSKKMSISETLIHIQKEKEENREKRHAEKLEMLRNFMEMFSKNNDTDNNK